MDRGAWWTTVHRVTKSQTRLSDLAHMHAVNVLGMWICGYGDDWKRQSLCPLKFTFWQGRQSAHSGQIKVVTGEGRAARQAAGLESHGSSAIRWSWGPVSVKWESHMNVWGRPFQAAAAAKSLQSCLTLCNPINGSPPGSPVPGILQARTLEWVAISFSNAWKLKVKVKSRSCVQLLATPWTAAHQAPPSMGFSRQEHWSGVPSPSPILSRESSKY